MPDAGSPSRPRLPSALKSPWRHPWAALLPLALGALLVAVSGLRRRCQWPSCTQRLGRGEVQAGTLRGGMTLPCIARMHHVPEAALLGTLAAPVTGYDGRALRGRGSRPPASTRWPAGARLNP